MRFLFAITLLALASTNSFSQESPLDDLTVTSTRLKCLSGFADVTYGYRRGVSAAAKTQLEFVVIETSQHSSRIPTVFHLNNKVDDVTPPAYLVMEENTVELPNENQVHEFAHSKGRYRQTDSDVTLAEIRAWLDQPDFRASIDSLLDHITKMRADKPDNDAAAAIRARATPAEKRASTETRWVQSSPKKIVWSSKGSANVLDDHSVELPGSNNWQEVTLYFQPPELTQISRVLLEVLPSARSRGNGEQRMVLFDVKPHLESDGKATSQLEFKSCRFLGNEADDTAANVIDFLSDTGWTVPDFVETDACHQLVLEPHEPITVEGNNMLAITIDSGGAPHLTSLSRVRVSFAGTNVAARQ